ncbi:MAG: FkbM family methyltransferase [Bacteroidales bacterium]
MKYLRKTLYKLLGIKLYLRLISNLYLKMINLGFFKNQHAEIHYLKSIIKPGDICIDIGANLGYYSYFMAKYCGIHGKVYAVEPVNLFTKILKKNTSKFRNIIIYPYALGEENCVVKMAMPFIDGVLHHGMTKISKTENSEKVIYFDVEMCVPEKLFSDLERLDFLKIDVEGYENIVLTNMKNILQKFHPLIQCELSGELNRHNSLNFLQLLGYKPFILKNKELLPISSEEITIWEKDFYFIYKQI